MNDHRSPGDLLDPGPEKQRKRDGGDIPIHRGPIIVGARTDSTEGVGLRDSGLRTADTPGARQPLPVTSPGSATRTEVSSGPLFAANDAEEFRSRWDSIQVGFVDEPRHSVEEADGLVAAAIKRLAENFASERQNLESQWTRGENVSTEDLRLALQRYRSFFGRLLSI